MVFGLAGLIFSFLNYRSQQDTKAKADQALIAAQQLAKHASLDFELRGNGELFLYIHNLGQAEARKVSVSGLLSNGSFQKVEEFPRIQPDAESGILINPSGFQIIAGHSSWELEVDWEDDAGRHEKVGFLATRRTS